MHTQRSYLTSVRQFLDFLRKSGIAFASVDVGVVFRYRDALKHELVLAPSSVNNSLAAIDHFFRFLNVPLPRIERETRVKAAPRSFSKEEVEKFLELVKRHSKRDQAIIYLLLYAGIRVSECAALNVEDVMLAASATTITVGTRNKTAWRQVPLDSVSSKAIADWLRERSNSFPHNNNPALFLTSAGDRLSVAGTNFLVKSLGWRARLEVCPQVLRNTCLKNWLMNGNDITVIAAMAGHKSLDTTLRYAGGPQ
jgi:site-specific recombinase XerD